MAIYKDIKISQDDLSLSGNQATIIYDADVIAQDLIHAIRESGLLFELLGERSNERRELLLMKIILLAEEDNRIVPGTVKIVATDDNFIANRGRWTLTANTYEFGSINLNLDSNRN